MQYKNYGLQQFENYSIMAVMNLLYNAHFPLRRWSVSSIYAHCIIYSVYQWLYIVQSTLYTISVTDRAVKQSNKWYIYNIYGLWLINDYIRFITYTAKKKTCITVNKIKRDKRQTKSLSNNTLINVSRLNFNSATT